MERSQLTTRQAAEILDVGISTLKRWADDGLIETSRTPGGHRRFTRQALQRFNSRRSAGCDGDDSCQRWIELLVRSDNPMVIAAELLLARSRLDAWWSVAHELGHVLDELGRLWESEELTVLQEHLASERLRRALTWTYQGMPETPGAPACMLITAAGDDHTLGLSLAELCCREAGWSTLWAGRRTPMADLKRSLDEGKLQMVAVSASQASSDGDLLLAQYRALAAACEENEVELVVGGMGAWPEEPPYGHRLHDFETFHQLLLRLTGRWRETGR